jgi:hypothetical protein
MDCAFVQAAGPGAPPVPPGSGPGTDPAAFGAVIDPLLAAITGAPAADSTPIASGGGAEIMSPAAAMLAALTEASLSVQPPPTVDEAPVSLGTTAPAPDGTPPVDADQAASAEDAGAPDPASAVPVIVGLPFAEPATPAMPAPGLDAPGADENASAVIDDDPSPAPATPGGPAAARAPHPEPPRASAPEESAAVMPPSSEVPPPGVSAPAPPADAPGTETVSPAAPRFERAAGGAAPSVLQDVPPGESLQLDAVSTAPSQGPGTADNGRQAMADRGQGTGDRRQGTAGAGPRVGNGRHVHAVAPSGVSGVAAALAAPLRAAAGPGVTSAPQGTHRGVEAGVSPHAAGIAEAEGHPPVVPGAARETASTGAEAAAASAFGEPGGSETGHGGNHTPEPGGSGQGMPAPVVSAAAPAAWAGWPAGQMSAAAPVAPGQATSTDDPVVPQLVKALHVQLRNGVGEARVQLDPHHLGAVSVTLRVDGGVVSAVITAEQPAVRHWLEAHESSLRGALADQGLQLDRLRVEPDGQSSDGRAPTGHEPPPRRRMLRKETATFERVA